MVDWLTNYLRIIFALREKSITSPYLLDQSLLIIIIYVQIIKKGFLKRLPSRLIAYKFPNGRSTTNTILKMHGLQPYQRKKRNTNRFRIFLPFKIVPK